MPVLPMFRCEGCGNPNTVPSYCAECELRFAQWSGKQAVAAAADALVVAAHAVMTPSEVGAMFADLATRPIEYPSVEGATWAQVARA